MPGTFNGKTLVISATPTAGAKIVDAGAATNVAGITISGDTMYSVKTSGKVTTLYKTPDYSNADAQAVAVKTGLGYFALGLSKIGTELFMLVEDTAGYGNTTKIVKMDTAGNVIKEFDIVSEFQYGALGIAHTGAANEFFILARGSNDADNDTLIVKKLRLESSNSYEVVHEFKVTNRGYGYTSRIQDIYYHLDYGLFILTNDELSAGRNRIVHVDYRSNVNSYIPDGVINVEMKGYKQYNLESICMKAGHLVLAANVITGTGKAEDRFSVLNGITYEKGTYSFNCALAKGMKVDNKEIGNIKTTNFGALAFDGDDRTQKLYGIKAGTNGKYANPSVCAAAIWEFEDYTSGTKGVKRLVNKVKPGEKRCLYHANGMDIYNHELYVTCAEPNGKGEYSVVKLTMGSTSEEWPYNRYTWENRTNAISHYKGNQFILLTETGAEGEEDKKIYKLCIVHFSAGKVVVDQTKYFMNTGYEVLQGINYSDKYGLFIVTTKKLEYFPNGDVQTSGSRVLHIDMSRTKTMKFKDGKKYPVLIPDFAFNNELDESKFFSFEMESVAIDRNTNNMIVSVNANSPIAGDNGKHPGEDYIYRFSSIEFK
ncbi:MAG: hypothetical protein KH160_05265 [Ruminococcus sp.]|jgi:hypothetical protein|uniref:hypothetical protein n=1 Tax=Blautia sp. TaxID=1955243 RepID=UPI002582E319|nr:hypothetical protein [Blautia sp.]MBS7049379.1 hypothetical protein [Ruminococcus sp.]MDU3306914.1 hypothetical protein [Lachnospiraceae bacterium]